MTTGEWAFSGAALLAPWRERATAPPAQRGPSGPTRSELMLWSGLDAMQCGWVREYATGRYRLDFFHPALGLAVEVDGSSHHGQIAREADEARDLWHTARGIETMRVAADQVERDVDGVMEAIRLRMDLRTSGSERIETVLAATGEEVVGPASAAAEELEVASARAESEIDAFVTGVACVTVLPAVASGWSRLGARVRGR